MIVVCIVVFFCCVCLFFGGGKGSCVAVAGLLYCFWCNVVFVLPVWCDCVCVCCFVCYLLLLSLVFVVVVLLLQFFVGGVWGIVWCVGAAVEIIDLCLFAVLWWLLCVILCLFAVFVTSGERGCVVCVLLL